MSARALTHILAMKTTQNDATPLMCSTIGVLDERSSTHPDFHLSSARTESLVIMLVEYELGAELPLHKQKDVSKRFRLSR